MGPLLKTIFDLLVSNFSLFDNVVADSIAFTLIGFLAYITSFKLIGLLYSIGILNGRGIGSVLHWVIRFIILLILYRVASILISLFKLLTLIPTMFWLASIGALVVGLIGIIVLKLKQKSLN